MIRLEQLKQKLSNDDLVHLGLEDTAYVKSIIVDGHNMYVIHAADGTPLTMVAERETAFATIRQHEMEPASVH